MAEDYKYEAGRATIRPRDTWDRSALGTMLTSPRAALTRVQDKQPFRTVGYDLFLFLLYWRRTSGLERQTTGSIPEGLKRSSVVERPIMVR